MPFWKKAFQKATGVYYRPTGATATRTTTRWDNPPARPQSAAARPPRPLRETGRAACRLAGAGIEKVL